MPTTLKQFMKENFDFPVMKKAGIFPKEMKFTDYQGQAEVICRMLSLGSIYDYGEEEIRAHLSVVVPKGVISIAPFITVSFRKPRFYLSDSKIVPLFPK